MRASFPMGTLRGSRDRFQPWKTTPAFLTPLIYVGERSTSVQTATKAAALNDETMEA